MIQPVTGPSNAFGSPEAPRSSAPTRRCGPIGRTVAAGLLALVAGCEPPSHDLVVYVSADEHVARTVIDAFERESGLRVGVVGDTELQKTTCLLYTSDAADEVSPV